LVSNITVIQTDYSETSLAKAFQNQDAIVSTIGALGTLTQVKLINAAIISGVKRFIPSDFSPNSPYLSEMEKTLPELYMRLKPKATIIEYLVEQAASHQEFSWTAVGSGPLFDFVCIYTLFSTLSSDHWKFLTDVYDRLLRTVS
jgi:hypothetical protein